MSQNSKEIFVSVRDCEHEGDLGVVARVFKAAGCTIVSRELDDEGESGSLRVRLPSGWTDDDLKAAIVKISGWEDGLAMSDFCHAMEEYQEEQDNPGMKP